MHWKTASVSAFSMSGAEGRKGWGFVTPGRGLASLVSLGWAPVGSPRGAESAWGRMWCWTALASSTPARLKLGVHCRLYPSLCAQPVPVISAGSPASLDDPAADGTPVQHLPCVLFSLFSR